MGINGYGYIDNVILLAEILCDGENINLKMLEAGLAEIPKEGDLPKNLNRTPYLEAEGRAKAAPEGMWTLGSDYVSPAKWRETHRSKSAAAMILYGILEEGAK
ncbi:MAG: thermonuclease family protein [Deltaproteobacteria bacterium]|nr:thermonuclease family protein [Deltaproteobacteria bacterium]